MPPKAARPGQFPGSLQDTILNTKTARSANQLLPGAPDQTQDGLIGTGPFGPLCGCLGCLCTEA